MKRNDNVIQIWMNIDLLNTLSNFFTYRDFLVKEDLKVIAELKVMQEFQVRVDYLVLLETKENEEKEECVDLLVHPVQLENVEHQEHQVFQVPMDQWDPKVYYQNHYYDNFLTIMILYIIIIILQVNLEIVDPLAQQDQKELQEIPVVQDHLDYRF